MGKQRYHSPAGTSKLYNAAQEREHNFIGTRLAQARKERGLSLAEFSTLLRSYGILIGRQGLGKWESGDAVPNGYQLLAACHALRIENATDYFTESPAPEDSLNDLGLKKLRDYREDLIASGRYAPVKSQIVYITMPVSTLSASAGTGAFLDDDRFELLSFPEDAIPAGADFGVRVSGDSMEPVYHDGQIVWVQRCSSLLPGQVGLFLYDGEGYIKVYQEQQPDSEAFLDSTGVLHPQPVLVSYNRSYAPRVVSPELSFTIAGRVLS